MHQFKRVLAAVDMGASGGEVTAGSRRALERAVWIARRAGASLTVLHSDESDEHGDPQTGGLVAGTVGDGHRMALVERAVAEFSTEGIATRVVVRPEPAPLAIVREVLEHRIDVVVAGKRTSVHSDDRKLGKVARDLQRICPCAVWLEDPRESQDPSVILAATDLTPVGDRVVELSASVADAVGAKLHVVHAYSTTMEMLLEPEDTRRSDERQERDRAIVHIGRVLAKTPISAAADVHVGLTSPTQAVLEGVARLRPGLVVMGTISRGGLAGLLVGNTAEKLMDRIDCALLTVKPRNFVCPVTVREHT